MRTMDRLTAARLEALALGTVLVLVACAPVSRVPAATANGQERMPAYASIWISSEPPVPTEPVVIRVTDPVEPGFDRSHTFVAGAALRGSVPLSSGRFRLDGLGGACVVDVFVGPERETDVLLRLDDEGGCALSVAREHGIGAMSHEEPSILIAPGP